MPGARLLVYMPWSVHLTSFYDAPISWLGGGCAPCPTPAFIFFSGALVLGRRSYIRTRARGRQRSSSEKAYVGVAFHHFIHYSHEYVYEYVRTDVLLLSRCKPSPGDATKKNTVGNKVYVHVYIYI